MVELKVVIILGVVASIVLALGLLSYVGQVLSDTMKAVLPEASQAIKDMSSSFFGWAIAIAVVVVIVVIFILAYNQPSGY